MARENSEVSPVDLTIRKEAAWWQIELLRANNMDEIWPQFEEWLAKDARHLEVFEQIKNPCDVITVDLVGTSDDPAAAYREKMPS